MIKQEPEVRSQKPEEKWLPPYLILTPGFWLLTPAFGVSPLINCGEREGSAQLEPEE